MHQIAEAKFYSPLEEMINVRSHALGLLLSVIGLGLLIWHSLAHGGLWHIVSFSVFGVSLVILYAASTVYHSATDAKKRSKLRVVDHASIYILIAGTYTPYTLIGLDGVLSWSILALAWTLAVVGVTLKIFFTGRFRTLSTLLYVFMGWIIVSVIKPLHDNLPIEAIVWLMIGGLAYTVGAVIYSIKSIKFNHAIFHVFVLLGSLSHFISIYFYLL